MARKKTPPEYGLSPCALSSVHDSASIWPRPCRKLAGVISYRTHDGGLPVELFPSFGQLKLPSIQSQGADALHGLEAPHIGGPEDIPGHLRWGRPSMMREGH